LILRASALHNIVVKKLRLSAVIWMEKGQYVSKCPELGVASVGDNPREALENLKEAVELYLENAEALGMIEEILPSVESDERYITTIEVGA
jgi:predicted RNase H-like HicB family nuclease